MKKINKVRLWTILFCIFFYWYPHTLVTTNQFSVGIGVLSFVFSAIYATVAYQVIVRNLKNYPFYKGEDRIEKAYGSK